VTCVDQYNIVRANGLDLAYRALGDPKDPPLVLLHGRGGESGNWDGVAEQLAADRRVYVLDLRGHGRSSWPGTYAFELMRDDVRAFLIALGVGRTDVIGHSMGGAVALLLAQESPELVRRLVLEEPPPLLPLDPPRPHLDRPNETLSFDWPVVPHLNEQLNCPDPVWWKRLADLAVPTLLIAGGPDSQVDQKRLSLMGARIPGCRFVTIPAGHSVHASDPDGFLAEVRDFL
jgi:pimeloyl-ACP methyl ester carboxylesterase